MRLSIRGARIRAALGAMAAVCLACAGSAAAQSNAHGVWSFVSNPHLKPASLIVGTNSGGTAPGDIFVAPIGVGAPAVGQSGPLIVDNNGNPIYAHPVGRGLTAMNFKEQTYLGKPVLTWWQGTLTSTGIGSGEDVIVDSSYHTIATIRAGNGYSADLHEFLLTPQGTAYITAYKQVPVDLSGCCGGSRNGAVWDSVVQEIDIRTGRVLFQWDPLQHVHLQESYTVPVTGLTWDPYHVNSVDLDSSGNLLIGARNTWALYKVRRQTGGVYWHLGGKTSSFKLEPGVRFAYQHDARFQPNDNVSLFDDEAAPEVAPLSRAIVVHIDYVHRAVHLAHVYTHPKVLAGSQGSTQLQPNGSVFVGWGQDPHITEYSSTGLTLFDALLPGKDASYRSFRFQWVGRPSHGPALTVQTSGGRPTLYTSWNGETGIVAWRVLAGSSPSSMSATGDIPSQGFETTATPQQPGPYFQMQALDDAGNVLGTSAVVHQ